MKLFEEHRPILELLDRRTDEARIVYNWTKIEEREQRRATLLRGLPLAAAAVILTTLVFALVVHLGADTASPPRGPLTLDNQPMMPVLAVPPGSAGHHRVAFSDGSRLTVAPGTTLEVIENTGRLFKTTLRGGWVRFDIVPNRGRSWIIDAGIASIQVIGTQFTVSRTSHALVVRVHRGTVHVRPIPFKGEIVELSAGESQKWTAEEEPRESAPGAEPPGRPDSAADDPPSTSAERQKGRGARTRTPSPAPASTLAGMGASEAVNDLLIAIDNARREGRHRRAAALLTTLIDEFPDDPVTGLAALTLARIRLDRLGSPASAAKAFRFAEGAGTLPGALREQAAARTVEAYHRAGNQAAARAARDRYNRRYPSGEWLTAVERWGADTE